MMTITIILVIILLFAFILFAAWGNYMFYFTIIKGIMIGVLYNADDYPEENITEHTFQVLIWMLSFTFTWETTINNHNNNNYAS
jgi:hypothetical protein